MDGINLLGRRIGNHAKTTDRILLEAVFGDGRLGGFSYFAATAGLDHPGQLQGAKSC